MSYDSNKDIRNLNPAATAQLTSHVAIQEDTGYEVLRVSVDELLRPEREARQAQYDSIMSQIASGLYLTKSANLGDLASFSAARTNLDVYSKAETDAKYALLAGSATQDFSAQNLTVFGDLDVRGEIMDTTSVVVVVDDAWIKLNTGNAAVDSGIKIDIGNNDTSDLYWKVSDARWYIGNDLVPLMEAEPSNNYIFVWDSTTRKLEGRAKAPDADLLDGISQESFVRSDVSDTVSATTTWTGSIVVNDKVNLGSNNFLGRINDFLELRSSGNQIFVGGATDMHVNYTTPTGGTPTDYYWHVGSSDSWANHWIGELNANDVVSAVGYSSGFAGSKWAIEINGDATFDNITVRKAARFYSIEVDRIRSGNGSYAFSDAIVIDTVSDGGTYWQCNIDTDDGNISQPFVVDDLLRCQTWTGRGVKYYWMKVIEIAADGSYFRLDKTAIDGTDLPEANDEVVRFGNTTDTSRQGMIYITNIDQDAPYMDILDGIVSNDLSGTLKVRLGKLSGVTSTSFGPLSGYGFYTNNGYLEGAIIANEGNIAGITLDSEKLTATNVKIWKTGLIENTTGAYSFANDGSGQIANSAISWDVNNNVTLSSDVKLAWGSDAKNLIDWSQVWTVGSDVISNYDENGTLSENERVFGLDPHGKYNMLWMCKPDANSDSDGGWTTDWVYNIDINFGYRYVVWVKRTVALGGTTAHGTNFVCDLNSTSINPNPFFWTGDLPALDQWYLIVGIIHPYSPNTLTDSGVSGVYDMKGAKVLDGTEFKWHDQADKTNCRSYLMYVTDTSVRQYFFNPMFHKLDGTEPSIQSIILGSGRPANLTYIDSSGAYFGTLTADQIVATGVKVGSGGIQMDTSATISWGQVTDTTPVTDSINTAQTTADNANTAAGTAQTTADNANTAAGTAQTTADNAAAAASAAQQTADDKITSAQATTITENTISTTSITATNLKVKILDAATGTFQGSLSAATGTFSGQLSAATGTFAGALNAATGTFAGELSAATGTFSGSLSSASGTFTGSLSAATGDFSGTITSTNGNIGGFSISSGRLHSSNGFVDLDSTNSKIKLGTDRSTGVGTLEFLDYNSGTWTSVATIKSRYNTVGKYTYLDIDTIGYLRFNVTTSVSGFSWTHEGNSLAYLNNANGTLLKVYGKVDADGDILSGGNLTVDGNITWGASDRRLKRDIESISGALNRLIRTRPVTYYLKNDDETHYKGWVAQELINVYPELVSERNDGYYRVNELGMIPENTAAIIELEMQVFKLKQQIERLQSKLNI